MTRFGEGAFGRGGFGKAGFSNEVGSSLIEKIRGIFPKYDDSTDFDGWLVAHQSEIDNYRTKITEIQRSLQIAHAEGQNLDLIGADFGQLGRRRGRSDSEYRQYLQSLVRAFGGRGTSQDIAFTVAASLVVDESTVDVVEDFEDNSYDLHIHEWGAHRADTVAEMAELADPPAIPLDQQIYIRSGEMSGQGETVEADLVPTSGLSSGLLGDLSSGSWNLSD